MPTDEKILGFGNIWYKDAIQNATEHPLSDSVFIKTVTASYFIATKLEAFKTRGGMDFLGSHDFEDIVSVIDGRPELVDEIKCVESKLKVYLSKTLSNIYDQRGFHDALPGHFVQYGSLAEDRIELFKERLKLILQC